MKYAAILLSVLCCLAIPVSAQIVHVWDLADTTQTGQFTVYNPDINDAEFGTPYYRRRSRWRSGATIW